MFLGASGLGRHSPLNDSYPTTLQDHFKPLLDFKKKRYKKKIKKKPLRGQTNYLLNFKQIPQKDSSF